METGLTKRQIITELTRSTHGDLKQFVPIGARAVAQDEEFFAHLIAWNQVKGQIRDSKVALPVIALAGKDLDPEYRENALAHLAVLDPRNLARAVRFQKSLPGTSHRALRRVVERYLRTREAKLKWWTRTAVQHRESMRELYALNHIKPVAWANDILFKGIATPGTVFHAIKMLPKLTDEMAAKEILNHQIPFLIVSGALGKRARSESLLHAMVTVMTPSELVTNMKMLDKAGAQAFAAVRGAIEAKLKSAKDSTKVALKTTRAAEALEEDDPESKVAKRLRDVQEAQVEKLGTIEGNWLVLADKSGSMEDAIEAAREVAGALTRFVKGEVHLVFFDTSPTAFECTGKTIEQIKHITRSQSADGGTSIGCGLEWARLKGLSIDGIAIVSDGQENSSPRFTDVYNRWFKDEQPPVYFYRVEPSNRFNTFHDTALTVSCKQGNVDVQLFDLGHKVDYYSLPNLVQTMRANKYSLADEIMSVPLLTLDTVFDTKPFNLK